uniref:Uncharacterized protein n=1 Tax=Timema bartmani TaxID=61472 RepID=A0A7R9EWI0_9NEOP|nr:unnamed protein product [Timema bartmani]
MAMSGNHKFGISRSFSKQGHVKDVHTLIGEQLGQEFILDGGIIPSSFIETNVDILCVKYTANHEYLAVGFTDGYVRLFRPRKGECVFSLMDTETLENPVPVSDIKHRLSSRANPGWKYESGHCVYTIHEHRQTLGLEFHRRSPKFLTVGNDSIIYMYDEETRTQEQVFKSSARFHPRNNYEFVSGGWDNTIQFWDIRQQFSVRNFGGVHICGNGIDISQSGTEVHYLVHIVHSGGTKLLTCSWQPEDPIKLWDYGSGKLISVVKPDIFLSKLYCGLFIAKDFFMCGGTDTNLFRVVDQRSMSSLGILRGLDKGVYSMDVGPLVRQVRQSFQIPHLPRVAFCAGRKIYEIDFH